MRAWEDHAETAALSVSFAPRHAHARPVESCGSPPNAERTASELPYLAQLPRGFGSVRCLLASVRRMWLNGLQTKYIVSVATLLCAVKYDLYNNHSGGRNRH